MRLDRTQIAALIPHQGCMCLLDAVESLSQQGARGLSRSHADASNPLRSDAGLSALTLIEYAGQAAAVHGAWLAQQQGVTAKHGLLAVVRDLELSVAQIDGIAATLQIEVLRLSGLASGWLYQFSVRADQHVLAQGKISIIATR